MRIMKKPKRIWTQPLIAGIGMLLMTLTSGCAKHGEFVMREGIDRAWVDKGQELKAPENGVFLSDRAFKHYSKGCE